MIRNTNANERTNTMLVYESHNEIYSAEIRTTDHPTSKYVATFTTIGNVTPRCTMTCGWNTLEYAHKMIQQQVTNTMKYNQIRG